MMKPRRPLALAAALLATLCATAASAQTVIVRQAPPGSKVEVVLNAVTAGSGAADANGDAVVPAALPGGDAAAGIDAQIYLDTCDDVRRVLVLERGLTPPAPDAGCARHEVPGIYFVRDVTSIVVLVGGPTPAVLLRQGSYSLRPPRIWSAAPTGIVLFGGGGFGNVGQETAVSCGSVEDCSGDDTGPGFAAGAAWWFTSFLAAEASYIRVPDVSVTGSEGPFQFDSFLETHLLTVAAKVGVPVGPMRFFGQVGRTYHRATSTTTQTRDPSTITVDGVPQTIEGGTQSFGLKTAGWGWLMGGGMEVWITRSFALYGEAGRAGLRGPGVDGGLGDLDDRLLYGVIGARIRIGG